MYTCFIKRCNLSFRRKKDNNLEANLNGLICLAYSKARGNKIIYTKNIPTKS